MQLNLYFFTVIFNQGCDDATGVLSRTCLGTKWTQDRHFYGPRRGCPLGTVQVSPLPTEEVTRKVVPAHDPISRVTPVVPPRGPSSG